MEIKKILKEDFEYENDSWDDGEVEQGKSFFEDGYDWKWIKRVGDVEHLDFDNWAVWMAGRPEDENNPGGRNVVAFFIVDEDTGFIDWGPCDTYEEAKEFLDSKVQDWEDDAELDEAWEPTFSDEWKPEDIELWKSIDWKARNYRPYMVEDDTFEGEVTAYGLPGGKQKATVTFAKELSPNPIYEPVYRPTSNPFKGTVGFMYDGHKYDGYHVMDRTETQEVYDRLSEDFKKEISNVHKHKGSFAGIVDANIDEINSMITSNADPKEFVNKFKTWIKEAELTKSNAKYANEALLKMSRMRSAEQIGSYLWSVRLKAENPELASIDSKISGKNRWKKAANEDVNSEDAPYTKEQIEQELRSITHNFTDKEGELKCGFEEEKNFGVEILKKYYEVVEVSGDDRREGKWYHISYAEPKNLKNESKDLTICPNCGGDKFNDQTGLCIDCGYDEKAYGELDESKLNKSKSTNEGYEPERYDDMKESFNDYIYLFPELTDDDIKMMAAYNIKYLGMNHGPDGSEDNWVAYGRKEDIEKYAEKYLGYELHPDYLYKYDDFAGEIVH